VLLVIDRYSYSVWISPEYLLTCMGIFANISISKIFIELKSNLHKKVLFSNKVVSDKKFLRRIIICRKKFSWKLRNFFYIIFHVYGRLQLIYFLFFIHWTVRIFYEFRFTENWFSAFHKRHLERRTFILGNAIKSSRNNGAMPHVIFYVRCESGWWGRLTENINFFGKTNFLKVILLCSGNGVQK